MVRTFDSPSTFASLLISVGVADLCVGRSTALEHFKSPAPENNLSRQ